MLEFGASMIIDQPVYGLLRRRSVSKWSMIMLVPNSSFIIWIYSRDCPKFCFPFKPHCRTIYNHFFAFILYANYASTSRWIHVRFPLRSRFWEEELWRTLAIDVKFNVKVTSYLNWFSFKLLKYFIIIIILVNSTWCQLRLDISLDSRSQHGVEARTQRRFLYVTWMITPPF